MVVSYMDFFFYLCLYDEDFYFFFFFQAEDGIRDGHVTWSSDVCSSDLKPRQLPLNIFETFKTSARLAAHATNLKPVPFESIAEWGRRIGGDVATDYLLTPVLGGIYAGDPNRLSAS